MALARPPCRACRRPVGNAANGKAWWGGCPAPAPAGEVRGTAGPPKRRPSWAPRKFPRPDKTPEPGNRHRRTIPPQRKIPGRDPRPEKCRPKAKRAARTTSAEAAPRPRGPPNQGPASRRPCQPGRKNRLAWDAAGKGPPRDGTELFWRHGSCQFAPASHDGRWAAPRPLASGRGVAIKAPNAHPIWWGTDLLGARNARPRGVWAENRGAPNFPNTPSCPGGARQQALPLG